MRFKSLIDWCWLNHRDDYIVRMNLYTAELLRDDLIPPQKGKKPPPISPHAHLMGMRIDIDEAMTWGKWEITAQDSSPIHEGFIRD